MEETDVSTPVSTAEMLRLRQEALKLTAAASVATSPRALEATLATISDEVTADAIERRNRAAKPE